MRVLHLTLKRQWFDLIASGEKKEEYREIKQFWIKRLLSNIEHLTTPEDVKCIGARFINFDAVHFASGGHFHPSIPQITLECKGIEISTGNPSWGAEPGKEYFVIKLGEIIKQ